MLLTFIAEVAEEPLILDPSDQAAETRTNTWSLSADAEERRTLSVEQVVAAFERTAEMLRQRVHSLETPGTATFYVWHDEQAGQLRCSTTSQPPHALPFGGAHALTEELGPIITCYLTDREPGLVEWTDLAPVGIDGQSSGDAMSEPRPFPVWTRRIGRGK